MNGALSAREQAKWNRSRRGRGTENQTLRAECSVESSEVTVGPLEIATGRSGRTRLAQVLVAAAGDPDSLLRHVGGIDVSVPRPITDVGSAEAIHRCTPARIRQTGAPAHSYCCRVVTEQRREQ